MKKNILIILGLIICLVLTCIAIYFIPNSLGDGIRSRLKSEGVLPYTAAEATRLAFDRCTSCHNEEKILKYCSRCGPPFIVVIHYMKRHIELKRRTVENFPELTSAEAVAITEAWNGLVGNWEDGVRREDLIYLLSGSDELIALLDVPISMRKIESELAQETLPGAYSYEQMKKGQH
jgi:hypothetical protein